MKLFRCVFLILMLAMAPAAYAKKGLLIFNTGDELFQIGPFPESVLKEYPDIKNKGLIVASFCDHFGILWADVWTWNCHLVGSEASLDSYYDLPADVQAAVDAQYKVSDAKRGFWNHYAFWLALVLLGALIAYGAFLGKNEEPAEETT